MSGYNLVQIFDIALVAFLIYRLLILIRSTRAWKVLIGILVFVIILLASDYFKLNTLHWILEKATLLGPVALVILFLPELRQTLEGFAPDGLLSDTMLGRRGNLAAKTVEELVAAMAEMSTQKIGALLIIERSLQLDSVVTNGVALDAELSAPLLMSIFHEGNPLHDGAAVIRGDRIVAAACRLPLSESVYLDKNIHMRHRAGIGISEQADCVVFIVSEERGSISMAKDGKLTRLGDYTELRAALNAELRPVPEPRRRLFRRASSRKQDEKKDEVTA
jgi:diadenylate cyclase